ncbi:MAG: HAD family phosphatase [Candidatus Moraniibacteriota bacterium]|nr:MAG: HAD family phosphatase [Candidatus Moranbacteria bacterium]
MKKKAIIFDLDGTAIDSPVQKLPTESLKQAIRAAQERYFLSSATGRVWSFAKPVLQALGLTDPCIISAGTQICNPVTGNILWQKNIDPSALVQVVSIFCEYPEWKLLFNDGTEEDYFHGGVFPKDFSTPDPVYFLEQVFVPDTLAAELFGKLSSIAGITCVMVVSQKPGLKDLHIVNSEATKEQAVAQLLGILGSSKDDAIGIGDGHNDMHLFNAVGYRVAMGNAIPELKNVSDEIIGSVKEDGLARYLRSLH